MPEIHSTNTFTRDHGVKFMVYGKRDTGKTRLISTLPRPLVLASETGLLTLRDQNIPYVLADTIARLAELRTWLTINNYANIKDYDTIVWDGVSFCSHQILSECKDKASYKDPRKFYGDMADVIMPFIECIINLPKNVYVTAWEGEIYNPLGAVIGVEPSTCGKSIATYLQHFFDYTLNLAWHDVPVPQQDGTTITQRMAFLQTKTANGVFARDRANVLEIFEQADLGSIINKLKAAGAAK